MQPLFCSANLLIGVACCNLVKLPDVNDDERAVAGTLSVTWHSRAFNSDRPTESENDLGKITVTSLTERDIALCGVDRFSIAVMW